MAADMAGLVELSTRRIENMLGLTNDNATILLVAFSWNEKYILENYENLESGLVRRSGLNLQFDPVTEEKQCSFCGTTKSCTTRGCKDFFCDSCLKVYAEGRIQAGEVNIKCPLVNCNRMVAPSQLRAVVSDDYREDFRQGIVQHYAASKAPRRILGQLGSKLKGHVSRHWVGITATLVFAFMLCYMFCGGATVKCVGEFTLLKVAADYSLWDRTLKILFLFCLYKLVYTNSILIAIGLSSAATALIIVTGMAASVRSLCCLALRRRT